MLYYFIRKAKPESGKEKETRKQKATTQAEHPTEVLQRNTTPNEGAAKKHPTKVLQRKMVPDALPRKGAVHPPRPWRGGGARSVFVCARACWRAVWALVRVPEKDGAMHPPRLSGAAAELAPSS